MANIQWPEPLVVEPTGHHTHTLILLHGRGSNGERFGLELLQSRTTAGQTLAEHFPGLKFVFPTARKNRAVMFNRSMVNQWFHDYLQDGPRDTIYDGLEKTTEFIHRLIHDEAHIIGTSRIVIGGLSQGCAMSLHVLLNWQSNEPLLGYVGMSGYLPLASILDECFTEDGRGLVDAARDFASLPTHEWADSEGPTFTRTPMLLGHGVHDDRVSILLGREAKALFDRAGCDIQWKEYDEGHWYKVPDQLNDIVSWLQRVML
uniref:Phospholipase/carboxylesterase/thioesterase domain-containing protein n=1 Tax=Mycena chlorophos TaxID=658473 RepID=A0ABQ0LNN9_MYCCL|nr:predicted protein [Mycena chlorophos]